MAAPCSTSASVPVLVDAIAPLPPIRAHNSKIYYWVKKYSSSILVGDPNGFKKHVVPLRIHVEFPPEIVLSFTRVIVDGRCLAHATDTACSSGTHSDPLPGQLVDVEFPVIICWKTSARIAKCHPGPLGVGVWHIGAPSEGLEFSVPCGQLCLRRPGQQTILYSTAVVRTRSVEAIAPIRVVRASFVKIRLVRVHAS